MDHVLTGGKLELAKLTACFNEVFVQWNSVNMHKLNNPFSLQGSSVTVMKCKGTS